MPHSQNQIVKPGLHKVATFASTLLQTFSTIVTTVLSPHAKEVNYNGSVHIDCPMKIMNLIDSRNIYLLLHSKCHTVSKCLIYGTLI